jgi:hypothetical protein
MTQTVPGAVSEYTDKAPMAPLELAAAAQLPAAAVAPAAQKVVAAFLVQHLPAELMVVVAAVFQSICKLVVLVVVAQYASSGVKIELFLAPTQLISKSASKPNFFPKRLNKSRSNVTIL